MVAAVLFVPGKGPEVDMKVFLLVFLESVVFAVRPLVLIWCGAVMLFCDVCGVAVVRGIWCVACVVVVVRKRIAHSMSSAVPPRRR